MATSRGKKTEDPTEEIGWTIRMKRGLATRIKALADRLTEKGQGRWTGQMVVLRAIERGLDAMEADEKGGAK